MAERRGQPYLTQATRTWPQRARSRCKAPASPPFKMNLWRHTRLITFMHGQRLRRVVLLADFIQPMPPTLFLCATDAAQALPLIIYSAIACDFTRFVRTAYGDLPPSRSLKGSGAFATAVPGVRTGPIGIRASVHCLQQAHGTPRNALGGPAESS